MPLEPDPNGTIFSTASLGVATVLLALDKDDWWPKKIKERVASLRDELLGNEFMETLINSDPFRAIAEELEAFIFTHRVMGYHCTKEQQPGYFEAHGLRVLRREDHQAEFVQKFGTSFSTEELAEMQRDWSAYFDGEQDRCRNGRLWLCLAPDQVVDSGTKQFFAYYGGESVYVPIVQHSAIKEKLRAIGNPVVVEVSIDPGKLCTFLPVPFALNTLSRFHHRMNPDAHICSREGYLICPINPVEIVRVTPKATFFSTHV